MNLRKHELRGLQGTEPLAFLAALGVLEVLSRSEERVTLAWDAETSTAQLQLPATLELMPALEAALQRDREGDPWLDTMRAEEAAQREAAAAARDAQLSKAARNAAAVRKKQHTKRLNLKHAPEDFRQLMRSWSGDRATVDVLASLATGVITDTGGLQSKPTALHFAAGQMLLMTSVLRNVEAVTADDILSTVDGPWQYRSAGADLRWMAGSDRSRALLSFEPKKTKGAPCVGANWLAYHALALFPCVPNAGRVVTTGFRGKGKHECLLWPLWSVPASRDEVRVLLGLSGLDVLPVNVRRARGIDMVLRAEVVRSDRGYGNFAAAVAI